MADTDEVGGIAQTCLIPGQRDAMVATLVNEVPGLEPLAAGAIVDLQLQGAVTASEVWRAEGLLAAARRWCIGIVGKEYGLTLEAALQRAAPNIPGVRDNTPKEEATIALALQLAHSSKFHVVALAPEHGFGFSSEEAAKDFAELVGEFTLTAYQASLCAQEMEAADSPPLRVGLDTYSAHKTTMGIQLAREVYHPAGRQSGPTAFQAEWVPEEIDKEYG